MVSLSPARADVPNPIGGAVRVWQSRGDPPVSPLSPSPPQKYLGPGEDGPEEVDDPELELVGELPAGLEALCKDKG